MRTVQQSVTLFASLLLVLLLVLIVINDWHGTFEETKTIIMDCMSTYKVNLSSCPCPSNPPRIITTLLFQSYTYSWVMLLIVLYGDGMLVRMTWYTDDSVTTIHVMSLSVLYVGCVK